MIGATCLAMLTASRQLARRGLEGLLATFFDEADGVIEPKRIVVAPSPDRRQRIEVPIVCLVPVASIGLHDCSVAAAFRIAGRAGDEDERPFVLQPAARAERRCDRRSGGTVSMRFVVADPPDGLRRLEARMSDGIRSTRRSYRPSTQTKEKHR